jgi:hypothetical protein
MDEFEDCDEDGSSSDDGGILFSRGSLKGERASNGTTSSNGHNDAASTINSTMSLVYQPGAILQCFELAVVSHDNPDPSTAASWEAPPLTNPVVQAQQAQPHVDDTAPHDDEASDGEIVPPSSSSASRPASHASILRDWKPRAIPEPDWMTTVEALSSGAAPPTSTANGERDGNQAGN